MATIEVGYGIDKGGICIKKVGTWHQKGWDMASIKVVYASKKVGRWNR